MSTDSTPNNPVAADQQLTISELKNQLARYEQVLAAPARDSDDDDFIDLREVWNLLWRRRWTIFIVAGVVLVATIIYTAMMTPIFRASTVLQIERDVGKVMEYAGVTTEERGTNDFYQTSTSCCKAARWPDASSTVWDCMNPALPRQKMMRSLALLRVCWAVFGAC